MKVFRSPLAVPAMAYTISVVSFMSKLRLDNDINMMKLNGEKRSGILTVTGNISAPNSSKTRLVCVSCYQVPVKDTMFIVFHSMTFVEFNT